MAGFPEDIKLLGILGLINRHFLNLWYSEFDFSAHRGALHRNFSTANPVCGKIWQAQQPGTRCSSLGWQTNPGTPSQDFNDVALGAIDLGYRGRQYVAR